MPEYLHIDDGVNIRTGAAAADALRRENDQRFLSGKNGVVQVDQQRWRTAQGTELTHWMKRGRSLTDDRNQLHFARFDNYQAIRGMHFRHAIELGCGPFTNLRLLGSRCQIDQCSLLDPLIEQYLTHPHCAYTRTELRWERPARWAVWQRLGSAIRRRVPWWPAWRWPGRAIPVRSLFACPIEEMPLNETYDLVVLINVIEHCYDARAVLDKVLAMLAPGGVLIFHDKLFDHQRVSVDVRQVYDAAHPLQVDRQVVEQWLAAHFQALFQRNLTEQWQVAGMDFSADVLYFIGRK
jgi:SAM-dependent methyltransferase